MATPFSNSDWFAKRRPELKELFQRNVYGYLPPPPKSVTAKIDREDKSAFNGKATLQEISITFGPPNFPKIPLLLVVPNKRTAPAPAFVGLNFSGNHSLVNDSKVRIPPGWMYTFSHTPPGAVVNDRATQAGRGSKIDVWALEQSIDRGYAVATFYNGDVEPDVADNKDGLKYQWFKDKTPTAPDCGTIGTWAWCLQRAVDYLLTHDDIDPARIAAVGHSRLGKTALLATAFDDRIALCVANQSGQGGMAPARTKVGETVKKINDGFPHWFCATFKTFNDNVDALPLDQHNLVELVAPRPLLATNAVGDTWANPQGQFDVMKAADHVYRTLGTDGLKADKFPDLNVLIDSTLGYYIRPGEHSMTSGDWKIYLDFADKHLTGRPSLEGEAPAEPLSLKM